MLSSKRRFLAATLTVLFLISGVFAQASKANKTAQTNFFPYQVKTKTLPNGLTVIVISTPEFKDMVTYATAVFAGSRNETEKGKTGLAHLFEHIIFRHEINGKAGGYEEAIRRMGAHNNAWTDYDMTFYHPTTFSENLFGPIARPEGPVPGLIELEAARFKGLTLDRSLSHYKQALALDYAEMVYNGLWFGALRRDLEARGARFRTSSDTEVILRAYEADGPACVARLRGMFAFALWDERNECLLLARDRIGRGLVDPDLRERAPQRNGRDRGADRVRHSCHARQAVALRTRGRRGTGAGGRGRVGRSRRR